MRPPALLVLLLAAAKASASFDVRWAQDDASLSLTFSPKDEEVAAAYPRFSYKATLNGPGSVLRAWFQGDTDTETYTKFLRLHLGGHVNTTGIHAEAAEGGGATLRLPKITPGFWTAVVLSSTDRPVSATYNFEAASGAAPVALQIFEYQIGDVKGHVSQAITRSEGQLQLTGEDVDAIAEKLANSIALATPVCHLEGHCVCVLPFVFDGHECVNGRVFAAPERHIRSHTVLGGRVFPDVTELLSAPLANVSAAFNEYQETVLKAPRFPHTLYAQLFASPNARVAVVGAGLEFFEAFVLGGLGARLTVIDSSPGNLKLIESFAEQGVPPFSGCETVLYAGVESLGNLTERSFDAVVSLDSLTHAPKEYTAPLFAKLGKLVRMGGRFLMLGPSRELYTDAGRPRFDAFDTMAKVEGYPIPTWTEYVERNKRFKCRTRLIRWSRQVAAPTWWSAGAR